MKKFAGEQRTHNIFQPVVCLLQGVRVSAARVTLIMSVGTFDAMAVVKKIGYKKRVVGEPVLRQVIGELLKWREIGAVRT